MKNLLPHHCHRAIVCAAALATLVTLPHGSVGADDPVVVKTDQRGLILEGQDAPAVTPAELLSAEEVTALSEQLRTGFEVPKQIFLRMRPVPEDVLQKLPRSESVIYRMNDGKVYAFDSDSYAVLDTVDVEVQSETTARPVDALSDAKAPGERRVSLKAGQIVPDSLTKEVKPVPAATAARLPAAERGTFYAWLDGAMYRVKATQYTVVEVIDDGSDAKSQSGRQTPAMTTEQMVVIKKAMIKGYRVPDQYFLSLGEVPATLADSVPVVEGAEYRYLDGVVYTIDGDTRRVLDAATVEQITGQQ